MNLIAFICSFRFRRFSGSLFIVQIIHSDSLVAIHLRAPDENQIGAVDHDELQIDAMTSEVLQILQSYAVAFQAHVQAEAQTSIVDLQRFERFELLQIDVRIRQLQAAVRMNV